MTSELVRGRFLFREVNERGFDLPLGSVTKDGGVEFRSDLDISVWNPGDDTSGYKRVLPGDFVIGLRSFQSGIGHSPIETIVSPAYTVLRPVSDRVHAGYFKYLFKSDVYISRLENVAQGIRQGRTIATEDFYNIECPIPPQAEQRAIADYLDDETARIDALIAKKQQLIHLLEERRSAFISAAVTTGLDHQPGAETGDELAPYIPSGWRLLTLRHLVERIVDTPHKTAPVIDSEDYLVARTANVKAGRLVYTDARYTDVDSWREWNRRGEPRIGDVLFTREAPAGEACVVPPDQPLCLGQRMVLLQVDRRRTTGEWLVHSIYSGPAQRFIESYSNSTTVAHLNMSDIPDIPVAVPPLDEQSRLLAAIQGIHDTVHRSKETLARQLHLLAEHRQALITAAVTGEFAVPGAA